MVTTLIFAGLVFSDHSCCASMKTLAADAAFREAHLPPQAIEFHPKYGHMAKMVYGYKEADVFVVPPVKKSSVGVLMIHEWWGLNDQIKREAERLHEATGYGVVAIDLYHGKVATTAEDAGRFMQSVSDADAKAIVKAAVRQLKRSVLVGKKVRKVGTIGYCFGGGWSFQAALLGGSDVNACVIYYGMPETDPAKLAPLKAPVLGIFGTRDKFINPGVVAKFEDAMKRAGKNLTVRNYDADHAFANPSNPKYDKISADRAWKEMLTFFRKNLG